jgi:hypothetical protein
MALFGMSQYFAFYWLCDKFIPLSSHLKNTENDPVSESLSIKLPAELVRRMRDIAGEKGDLSDVVFQHCIAGICAIRDIPAEKLVPDMNAVRAELLSKGGDA